MLPLPCFVCGIITNIYCKDVTSLHSKHTETNILDYLEKFIGHDLSDDVNRTKTNGSVVCQNCIIKIDEYDELYMNAKCLEEDLRNMLTKTLEKQNEIDCDQDLYLDEDYDEVTPNINDDEDIVESVVECATTKLPSMSCNICKKNFDSFTELANHEHIPKKTSSKEENIVKKQVVVAEGTFINCNNVMIQQQSHTTYLPKATPSLKCSLCSSMFLNRNAIREHYKEFHNDDGRCDFCGGLYADKLKEHRARHTNSKNPLECVECGKIFKARNPLMRHMATHTLERFFICELCGKQFTHHSSFKMHMLAHDDIREKKCDICDQSFRSTSHLNRHKRVHSGLKPYKCLICHRLFAQRYNMMSHYKAHSKESREANKKSYICSVCNMNFPSQSKLNDHCETIHYTVVENVES